uniref:Uncharacterized protein n=1 Tax=Tanacetum cinerariifolium TaxID=118510 RepID=A0A6L2MAZ9_TANCI|nr:hypothetical protein [Tanacetum cinerariifolium]
MRNLIPFEYTFYQLLMRGNNNTITFLMEVVICDSEAMDHMITKTSTRSCDPFEHMVHYTKRKWGTALEIVMRLRVPLMNSCVCKTRSMSISAAFMENCVLNVVIISVGASSLLCTLS